MKSLAVLLLLFLGSNIVLYSQDSPYYISAPQFENRHWMFFPQTDTTSVTGSWSFLQPLNSALIGVNSYYWPDSDKIFICGGLDSTGLLQTNCYTYNPALNIYQPKAPLPDGRWSGKLVRVRDSLYLIGSIGTDFSLPDGKIYRYSLNTNQWINKNPMPVPLLQESAVCVFHDSLVITIGGSTDRFQGATQYIRLYNPWTDSWRTSSSLYPVTTTTSHAECRMSDTINIVVMGGYGAIINDAVYKGTISIYNNDSLSVSWKFPEYTPFANGIYRPSGGRWGDYFILGPGQGISSNISQLYAGKVVDTVMEWHRIFPDMIDSTSNIPLIAVKTGLDSSYFYFFGGYRNLQMTSQAKFLSLSNTPPIGIEPVTQNIPKSFKLYQNYPNPFNPVTTIKFGLPKSEFVELKIFDILGREVAVLVREPREAGIYSVKFDASNFASGVYFCKIAAGNFTETKKLLLIK
jgi:hypothetical protein